MKKSIQMKISLVFLICALTLCGTISIFSYVTAKNTYISFLTKKLQQIVCFGASLVDGNTIDTYLETMQKDTNYEELQRQFDQIKKDFGLEYFYIFKPEQNDFKYILDAKTEGENMSLINSLGDKYEYTDVETNYLIPDVEAKKPSTEPIFSVSPIYGKEICAWYPVFDKDGNIAAMVEADLSMEEVTAALNRYVYMISAIITLIIFAMMLLLLHIVRRMIVVPINKLTNRARCFVAGELPSGPSESINTKDEIGELWSAFNKMKDDIDKYIINIEEQTTERERVSAELAAAKQIQISMLPNIFPPFPEKSEFDIYAEMRTARAVGGDFYDLFLIGENKVFFAIADVSGKAIPAALFMMISKIILKNNALVGYDVDEILYRTNNSLCEDNQTSMFATAFIGIMDINTGKLSYASAGHNPPLVKRKDGNFDWLPIEHSFVLGGIENVNYVKQEIQLEKEDIIFCYTDGVVEALNVNNEFYSNKRLIEVLNTIDTRKEGIKGLIKIILSDVFKFSNQVDQEDDITILAIEKF